MNQLNGRNESFFWTFFKSGYNRSITKIKREVTMKELNIFKGMKSKALGHGKIQVTIQGRSKVINECEFDELQAHIYALKHTKRIEEV